MRAVLLSAGPITLGRFDPEQPGRCGLRIGVNTAATKYACDWWVCADQDRFATITPLGTPALFTMTPERDKMRTFNQDKLAIHPRVATFDEARCDLEAAGVGPPPGSMRWSCPSALILARWLGVSELFCYGVDMDGDCDCTGQSTIHRNPKRWSEEKAVWDKLVVWGLHLGMTVTRATP